MLLLALSVVLLGTARAAGTSVSSCPLDKVLIQNGNSIVVDVRALGHCHNHEAVAHILKTASVKRSRGQITMSTYLTHSRHKGPYRDSCRKGIVKSIRSFEDNSVVADMSLLICFCGLARAFTTEIVQNGNILTDGNPRAEFEFDEYDVHQFNDDGMQMCKEFRRRAISNCMSHAIGNTATGFTDLSLEECISSFDHVSSLVRFNSHITHQGALDYTEQFVDTMIARETVMLGLHCENMRAPLLDGTILGRTPLPNLRPQQNSNINMKEDNNKVTFTKDMDDAAFDAAAAKLVRWHGGHSSFVNYGRRIKLLRLIAKSAQHHKLNQTARPRPFLRRINLLHQFWPALFSDYKEGSVVFS